MYGYWDQWDAIVGSNWSWDYDYGPDPDDDLIAHHEYVRSFIPDDIRYGDYDAYEEYYERVERQLAAEYGLLVDEEERWGGQTQSSHRSRLRARNFRR